MAAKKQGAVRRQKAAEESNEESDGDDIRTSKRKAKAHVKELQRLQEKDPEFYQFLKEHDKELLDFNDDDIEDNETEMDDDLFEDSETIVSDTEQMEATTAMEQKPPQKNVVTSAMVDSCINSIQKHVTVGAVRFLMKAFRTACHCGDDGSEESSMKYTIASSSVFNKIMMYVLSEMDGILRGLLKLPASGGKKETINDLLGTRQWKSNNSFVKSYLANALHVLNQMTDTEMISFTLRRLRYSSIFLAAFPSLLRRYIKVTLHFWGTGGGALPVASFLFLRDICIRLGSDCMDECFKGIYKAYVLNCHFVNAAKLQHIQFLGNCVVELLSVDFPTAYQHAFVFIRQLAMILREALTMKTKEAFRKVYEWKFMNCLELWTGVVCAYSSEADIRPLAYPLTQIIMGVARLVPTARYFPLRLRCIRMLNRIAASTDTFIPIPMLLLDMLEMKELNKPPTGGVGKAIDLRVTLKVSKPILKTRTFQEACVLSVLEELAEHLAQWSYSVAFLELSFIPAVQLRYFCKSTNVERFRRETRELIRQIEANCKFINERRATISFVPNDRAAETFLEDEKKLGASPLSQYVSALHQKSRHRSDSLIESSVIVGARSSAFGDKMLENNEENAKNKNGAAVFSSSWFPGSDSKEKHPKEDINEKKGKKKKKSNVSREHPDSGALNEDVVEDLVLSSDDDNDMASDVLSMVEDVKEIPARQHRNKRKLSSLPRNSRNKNVRVDGKRPMKKRKHK